MPEPVDDDARYCRLRVLRGDPDRAAVIAFQSPGARPALYALHALRLELTDLPGRVSDPALGAIRLQWWREAFDDMAAGRKPRNHQVVRPLARAVLEHGLPRESFEPLLDAGEADLELAPPMDPEAHAEATDGTIAALSARITGEGRGPEKPGPPGGLVEGLRRHGRGTARFREGGRDDRSPAVPEIAACARRHLRRAGRGRYARALGLLARAYLDRIERANYDLAAEGAARPLRMPGWRIALGECILLWRGTGW